MSCPTCSYPGQYVTHHGQPCPREEAMARAKAAEERLVKIEKRLDALEERNRLDGWLY